MTMEIKKFWQKYNYIHDLLRDEKFKEESHFGLYALNQLTELGEMCLQHSIGDSQKCAFFYYKLKEIKAVAEYDFIKKLIKNYMLKLIK